MNKATYTLLLCCLFALLAASCGDSKSEALQPVVDESSIECNIASTSITFSADYPKGTKLQLLLRQLTNGTEEKLIDILPRSDNQKYYISLIGLVGGSTYAYYIIGYDSDGKEVFRTAERTFTLPKKASPSAPITYGLDIHSPSSLVAADGYITGIILTTDIEYSTDGGLTWMPVTVEGQISGLRPGKVMLRKAETPTTEASQSATVKVPEYKSNTDIDGNNGTSEGLK